MSTEALATSKTATKIEKTKAKAGLTRLAVLDALMQHTHNRHAETILVNIGRSCGDTITVACIEKYEEATGAYLKCKAGKQGQNHRQSRWLHFWTKQNAAGQLLSAAFCF